MDGITILDLSRVLAGPWATQHLADQGARVIKVEPPGGDETRGFGPQARGVSTYFLAANRNKRSIVLDLKADAGRAVLGRLLAASDVVVENYAHGVCARLGLDWSAVLREHPRLVVVSIRSFGEDAPDEVVRRPGYDIVLQAMGGAASITGLPGGPPLKAGTSVADLTTGLLVTQAVLLGLLHRERTGDGQRIVVNMMQGQVAALAYHATRYTVTGAVEVQRGNAHAGLVPYGLYRCADGWIALGCGNDRMWHRLRTALSLPDDPSWRTNVDRVAARQTVDHAVCTALSTLTVAEADARLQDAAVPAGPVNRVDQAFEHPAVARITFEHPDLGTVRAPGPPIRTTTTITDHTPPPALGADRNEILADLGYDPAEIRALADRGAFGHD